MPVQIPADADLNTLRTPGFYWCDGATNANRPDDSGSFCLLIEKTGSWGGNGVKQTFTNYDSGAIYTRVSPKDIWNPWMLLATATPPQEFDLPLAEDITALQPCTYWKNQFGEVTIGGCAANGISDNITIATLPAGFRPAKAVERPATLSGGGERYAGSVLIGTDGAIRIRTPATTNAVVFGATFIAEN